MRASAGSKSAWGKDSHVITAAGGVPWRPGADGIEIALVHRPRYDDWSLPKGKRRAREHVLATAHREATEETGCHLVLGRRLPSRRYDTARGPKVVDYWTMRAEGNQHAGSDEVDRTAWISVAEARRRLSYPGDIEVLDAMADPRGVSLVLLVRHASAGDPDTWKADDRLRPVDAKGQGQAAALRRVLPLLGVTQLASVPNVRCVDTLAGLAADLEVPVADEPGLGKAAYAAQPVAGRRRIRELAAAGGVWAVCSQGTVIRHLVASLADEDNLPLEDHVRAKKGSLWALFLVEGRLAAADYYYAFTVTPSKKSA